MPAGLVVAAGYNLDEGKQGNKIRQNSKASHSTGKIRLNPKSSPNASKNKPASRFCCRRRLLLASFCEDMSAVESPCALHDPAVPYLELIIGFMRRCALRTETRAHKHTSDHKI